MNNSRIRTLFVIGLVSFGHLWHDIFTAIVTPMLPVLKENFSLNYIQAGWILVAVKFPSLLSASIAGFSEKHNPKWLIIICPLITSISVTLLGVAPNFSIIMLLVFITGLSAAAFHVPAPTILKGVAPNRLGVAMTAFQIGGEGARTLGPLVLVPILLYLGLNRMYYLIPVSILVSLFFYISFKKIDTKAEKRELKKGSVLETFRSGVPLFVLVSGISLHKAFISTILKSFLPLYLQSKGESLIYATGSLSLVQGATVLGVITAGVFVDRLGPKRILGVIISCSTILVTLLVTFKNLPFIPLIMLISFFSFASMPALYTLILNYGFKFPTTANGLFMSLNFGISSLILIVGGKLSDLLSIDMTYSIFSYSTLIGIPLLFLLFKIKDN